MNNHYLIYTVNKKINITGPYTPDEAQKQFEFYTWAGDVNVVQIIDSLIKIVKLQPIRPRP